MAAIVLADVQDVCPDVSAVPAAILAWVNGNGVRVDVFDGEDGATTKLVRCYLAGHFATIGNVIGGAGAGPLVSISEGGMSRSYATSSLITSSMLGGTQYGAQAALLMRLYAGGAWLCE